MASGPVIDVQVDASSLADAMRRFDSVMDRTLRDALRGIGEIVVVRAKASTSFNDRSGFLRASMAADEPTGSFAGGDLGIDVVAGGGSVYYAPFIEYGTRWITPRRPMRDAVEASEADIDRVIDDALDDALAELGL